MNKPKEPIGAQDEEMSAHDSIDTENASGEQKQLFPLTVKSPTNSCSDTQNNAEITPTPVSAYVTMPQADPEQEQANSPSDQLASCVGKQSSYGTNTVSKIVAKTALLVALGTTLATRNKPKTPRPPQVVLGNGDKSDAGDDADTGDDEGSVPPDAENYLNADENGLANLDNLDMSTPDASEVEQCTPDISADGRPVEEGTCVLVFSLGEDTVYKARLEKARVMIGSKNYEVEVDYGAVTGIAGNKEPDFLVSGSKHFLKAQMQLKGTIWVEKTENGKVATVKSEEGETLLRTSWTDDMVLEEGQYRTFSMEAPDRDREPPSCAVRWSGESPEKDADVWLSMLGALAAMGVARRKNKAN
jgi:hypothetical protein